MQECSQEVEEKILGCDDAKRWKAAEDSLLSPGRCSSETEVNYVQVGNLSGWERTELSSRTKSLTNLFESRIPVTGYAS